MGPAHIRGPIRKGGCSMSAPPNKRWGFFCSNLKRYMHSNVHSCTIHNTQDVETTSVSINRGMDKEDVVHIYTMEYYSAMKKNEILPLVETWMDLETVIQSEVRKRKTNTVC